MRQRSRPLSCPASPSSREAALLPWIILACWTPGCAMSDAHDHERDQHGQVVYLDGAGGGGLLTNWGRGVEAGLRAGGYSGAFDNHAWHTGLGVVADQDASVDYKREQARKIADEIVAYIDGHPGAPVYLFALSADHPVDTVVLLGSSVSNHYDLTAALRRVRGRLYVFTSPSDAVLRFAVSAAGTADRRFCGACSAGLHGFHIPRNPSSETRRLYGKIENIDWRPEFAAAGNFGGHTDATRAEFITQYVAPLLTDDGPRFLVAARSPGA